MVYRTGPILTSEMGSAQATARRKPPQLSCLRVTISTCRQAATQETSLYCCTEVSIGIFRVDRDRLHRLASHEADDSIPS
ncbi:hypothetical protein BaRGS_00033254 [Batillaria attramentaria]|uniref:Uncharacterized protein n=1 Tax=Batillaria attramentaria TaxID=370345 RepID=A0ABD0JLB3_9CAEN